MVCGDMYKSIAFFCRCYKGDIIGARMVHLIVTGIL